MEKVKVAIRVRPMNKREIELDTQNVVNVELNQISVNNPQHQKEGRKATKSFAFDYCFDSSSTDKPNYASQETVYNSLGLDIINNAFNGYNACIFAYGQTGSGKSFTMTGSIDNKGLIPRICEGLFENIKNENTINNNNSLVKIEVSYMEIYNEKVLDLLDPRGIKNNLKVREHNLLGTYVDGLSQLAVSSYKDIEKLINEGNKSRTVAATNMNSESSRSHAVFCLKISQTITDQQSGISGEKVSKLSLVDLAGSEKASKTGVEGERLKEGCNINRSLLTLGSVISALAENTNSKSNNNNNNANKSKHIPYRDSVLTWLLKDSLGGNSKTVMIATISPAFDNYEETISTLKYADRAKRIENHAKVNEDPNAKLIRELRVEVELLKQQLVQAKQNNELLDRLKETEKIYNEVSKPWNEKLAETEKVQQEWSETLKKYGISFQSSGIAVEKNKFYLVNMSSDPSMNELLVYYLKDSTIVGKMNNSNSQLDIQLSGPGIVDEHCMFIIRDNDVFVKPLNENAKTRVNGNLIINETLLHHGDRIVLGLNHFFRINCPNRKELSHFDNATNENGYDNYEDEVDYPAAQLEVLMNENDYQNAALTLENNLNNNNNNNQNNEKYKIILNKLKEQVIKANTLVREANVLSKEMNKHTIFNLTLQISPSNLKLNRNKDALLFEPAILVKRNDKNVQQIWSLEKFENRIVDMRDMYEEIQNRDPLNNISKKDDENDPFYEALENHKLIGVANLFLNSLLNDCKFEYSLPIVNQQGDIAGYLKVEIKKDNHFVDNLDDMESSFHSENSDETTDNNNKYPKKTIKCIITIKEAIGLPASLSNFVFCQYKFWNEEKERIFVPEADDENFKQNKLSINSKLNFLNGVTIKFNHSEEHILKRNEDFIDYCSDSSLAIEVWGHHNISDINYPSAALNQDLLMSKYANLIESWQQVRKSLKLWIDILELDRNGQWVPVNVKQHKKNFTGGVYQLKQGTSKRIRIKIEEKSMYRDLLPLYIDDVSAIEIGCVEQHNYNKLKDVLDSYQEIDLENIREKWLNFLDKRKTYVENECKLLIEKDDKTSIDIEREKYLMDKLVELTEERNLVYTPPPNSLLPGSILSWSPNIGMEANIPVLFLDSNNKVSSFNDSISYNSDSNDDSKFSICGNNCLLTNEEVESDYFILPIINKILNNTIESIAVWDSTIHENSSLNLVTQNDHFVYLIVKVKIKILQPIETEICLRKRICVQIYDPNNISLSNVKQMFSNNVPKSFKSFFSNVTGSQTSLFNPKDNFDSSTCTSTGVTYYIISNIPRILEDCEQYDNLAIMAAISNNASSNLIEKYLERYMTCIKTVDRLLENDRKQQEIELQQAIRAQEGLSNKKSSDLGSKSSLLRLSSTNLSNSMSKTISVPNLLNSKSLIYGSSYNINLQQQQQQRVTQSASATSNCNRINQNQNQIQTTPVIMSQYEPKIMQKNIGASSGLQKKLQSNNLINKFDMITTKQPIHNGLSIFQNDTQIKIEEQIKNDDIKQKLEPITEPEPIQSQKPSIEDWFEQKILTKEENPISIVKIDDIVPNEQHEVESEKMILKDNNTKPKEQQISPQPNNELEKLPEWMKDNTYVIVSTSQIKNQPGRIRFIGEVEFAKGIWIGVELDRPNGLNNGSIKDRRYFICDENKGVFVKIDKLVQYKNPLS